MENTTEIYYMSATEARQAGQLEAYRASAAALLETRSAIDAAISGSFDGWTLNRRCLDDVLQACSAEAVAIILVATLTSRTHDGRFKRSSRAWAESVRLPAVCTGYKACWFECQTHSAILDGFIGMFIRWQAETISA